MRAVVVTGASSGIGRSCALRLDAAGWCVFAGVRSSADGDALRAAASERLVPVIMDVTDLESIQRLASVVSEAVGADGLQGLVNNAGVATGGVLEAVDLAEFRHVLEVNVTGQLAVTQRLIPLLRLGRGRIVMMSSISGRSALPIMGPYAASKHALEALTDALRLELHPWGIHVSAVEPGTIATPIWAKALATAEGVVGRYPPEMRRLYGPLIDAMIAALGKVRGAPVELVSDAVLHALQASRPKTRYVVGKDARSRVWVERLPDRLRDRVLRSRLPRFGE
jgi:NAD(P)-dependent dehydrogenase (short-subunit alcohol dehydrogenase family)